MVSVHQHLRESLGNFRLQQKRAAPFACHCYSLRAIQSFAIDAFMKCDGVRGVPCSSPLVPALSE